MKKPTVGQRVKDRFKQPRPGDESVYGEVIAVQKDGKGFTVRMESGWPEERSMPMRAWGELFVPVD